MLAQFVGVYSPALARPGLVDPDIDVDAPVAGLKDRFKRRAMVDRRCSACAAVEQQGLVTQPGGGAVRNQRRALLANAPIFG